METQLELCPGTYIGPGQPVFVVAEIGQNHQVSCDWFAAVTMLSSDWSRATSPSPSS